MEKPFCWEYYKYVNEDNPHKLPYKFPWVGFVHNCQNMPSWFDYFSSPQVMLEKPVLKESLKSCRGLFVLSDYLRNWLKDKVDVPVFSLKHPTGPGKLWNARKFLTSKEKNIIQLGYWLRKLDSICHLKTHYKKFWMPSNPQLANSLLSCYYQTRGINWLEHKKIWKDVKILEHLSNEAYDEFLSQSVVYLNLYDSSANNAVIECIVRNTPIMVNRHQAVVEYLGPEYPLYFDCYDEFPTIGQILSANSYLADMNKEFLSGEFFLESICEKLCRL